MIKASIIIPCYNGGALLRECLTVCLTQAAPFGHEVIAIDSASTDGTREYLLAVAREDPRLRVLLIRNEEFGHGRTRNLGASQARGEFLCYLTQDAIPASANWLAAFVAAMEACPAAAGAFGRHLAHPGHSAYTAHKLDRFFAGFGEGVQEFRMDSLAHYESDQPYRQRLHFFSDNNSCLRRSVWQELPYDDVPFGEDQLWADKIIRRGLTKLYVADAIVRHSHEFGLRDSYQRAKEEGAFFGRHFGYVLKKSHLAVLRSATHLTRQEFKFLRSRGSSAAAWARVPPAFICHLTTMWGHLAGTRSVIGIPKKS